MKTATNKQPDKSQHNKGIALMVVLVLLIALSFIGYMLSLRVMAHRHRSQYMIDYQIARYACDSAVKYALTTLGDIDVPDAIARPNEPDFSDLFALDETEYREMLANWAQTMTIEQALSYRKQMAGSSDTNDLNDVSDFNDILDINELMAFARDVNLGYDPNDPNLLQVPGPYGPPWPLIVEPVTIDIGDAAVTIEIHDENAKYPISWLMLKDPEITRQIGAGFENFCEWMDVNLVNVDQLYDDLEELGDIKEFKLKFGEIKITKKVKVKSTRRSSRSRRSRRSKSRTRYKKVTETIPSTVHLTDFARLYHSAMIDTDAFAKPIIETDDRAESALKYMSLWPTTKVNINTAPRNVLESALAFAGISDAVPLADEIIKYRKTEPFSDPNDIRQKAYRYSEAIDKCREYIVTTSDFFTIRVTASSGLARTSAIIAVRKNAEKMEKIAVLSD